MSYETDFAAWADTQADALGRRATNEIDWENVAEEIESLSRSDRRQIRSRLAVICEHFLKWEFQPDARSPSWRVSIREGRDRIADLIEESPSLVACPATYLSGPRGAYARGRSAVADTIGFIGLPATCPWTVDQLLDPDFWPGSQKPRRRHFQGAIIASN
jgi:hypothetical protein